jgi:transposase-like protein
MAAPGPTSDERRRFAELERENRDLRRANEILKAASAFLARELDPRLPRGACSTSRSAIQSGWPRQG